MSLKYTLPLIKIVSISFLIIGCQGPSLSLLKEKQLFSVNNMKSLLSDKEKDVASPSERETETLTEMLNGSVADLNNGNDYISVVRSALNNDPIILTKMKAVEAKLAATEASESQKNYQVTSTLYGGLEDISDNTKGAALGINATRMLFDGGLLDSLIASKNLEAEAAELELQAVLEERAYSLGAVWVEREKYEMLKRQIDERLAVLDPLIAQLDQVAKAGIGDISRVTAAQRTVSVIRVTQTNIYEGLAKARLEFKNAYGSVDEDISYDANFISGLLPNEITDKLVQNSPVILAKYTNYKAAVENVKTIRAKDDFNVGFEARALKPFAGSSKDSDESIGLVARKTLFNGGMLEAEIDEALALAAAAKSQVEATHRQSLKIVQSAMQSIESMDKAITLARENAQIISEEIAYLRQQLIIGGSTLDNVLSAEARLYDAESKEINFIAEKRLAELIIASALGLLAPAFDP